jgi:hypothetical protein
VAEPRVHRGGTDDGPSLKILRHGVPNIGGWSGHKIETSFLQKVESGPFYSLLWVCFRDFWALVCRSKPTTSTVFLASRKYRTLELLAFDAKSTFKFFNISANKRPSVYTSMRK